MTFVRPIQWYRSQADPVWPDSTFKKKSCIAGDGWYLNSWVLTHSLADARPSPFWAAADGPPLLLRLSADPTKPNQRARGRSLERRSSTKPNQWACRRSLERRSSTKPNQRWSLERRSSTKPNQRWILERRNALLLWSRLLSPAAELAVLFLHGWRRHSESDRFLNEKS